MLFGRRWGDGRSSFADRREASDRWASRGRSVGRPEARSLKTAPSFAAAVCLAASILLGTTSAPAVVISEIHYNPAPGDEGLEFIELTNETPTPEDLSRYSFSEGVEFAFPDGTILMGHESIVVCADVDAVQERYGIENAVGNFVGRLESDGERLELVNHSGAVLQSVRFRDDGKWPVGPDGTGHTLILVESYLDSSEPESWTMSPELGGTPGRRNFPDPDEEVFIETVIIPVGEEWRFARGTEPYSDPPLDWTRPGFDDAAWEVGPSGIGYGDDDDATVIEGMEDVYTTLAFRKRVTLTQEELDGPGVYFLAVNFDDGFCAYIGGEFVGEATVRKSTVGTRWRLGLGSRDRKSLSSCPEEHSSPVRT